MKGIQHAKQVLNQEFKMKDLGELSDFLGIEVDRSHQGIFISQKKYMNDLITEYGMKSVEH